MTRRPPLHLAAILAVVAASALPIASASASAGAAVGAAAGAKISLRRTSLGMILVNARGRTLYAFTRDARNKDRCVTTAGCRSTWPVMSSAARPRAGRGLASSKLATITLPDRSHQVTYAGRPLYTYTGDEHAGDTGYVGVSQFGGAWLALNAAGRTVR
jgi:predicted lipoprotein with Yx(FWY)xxD motif